SLTIGAAVVVIVIALVAGTRFIRRQPDGGSAGGAQVALPPPVDSTLPPAPVASDFAGSDRCASCHQAQYAAWRGSTHGTAGGAPARVESIRPLQVCRT